MEDIRYQSKFNSLSNVVVGFHFQSSSNSLVIEGEVIRLMVVCVSSIHLISSFLTTYLFHEFEYNLCEEIDP